MEFVYVYRRTKSSTESDVAVAETFDPTPSSTDKSKEITEKVYYPLCVLWIEQIVDNKNSFKV